MPDHLGSFAWAILLFPLVLWIPGTVLGYSADVLQFRIRSLPVRIAMGLLLSLSVCPILSYLLVRAGGFRAAWVFFGIVWAVAAVMVWRGRRSIGDAARELFSSHKTGLGLAVCWVVFCALWEVDFVTSGGVFRDLNTMDAVAHVAFTDALTRTGIPPANPFVYPGHPLALFYYYTWYLICSLVDQLGGPMVTPRAAVQAGTCYIGLGVAALIIAYSEILGSRLFGGVRKLRTGIALALLTVTGLDLIPWALLFLLHRFLGLGPGAGLSIEYWNEQVTAWLGAILMSPHHPAAMVVCFTVVLLLFGAMETSRGKLVLIGIMALGLASAAAMSAYVALAFGAGVLLWFSVAARRGWWGMLRTLCAAGVLAAALYAPLALELRAASHETQLPIAPTIRAFTPVDYWLPSIVRSLKHMPRAVLALRLVFLPVNYFAELGFFLLAAIFYWRGRRSLRTPLAPEESLLLCLATGSILVCTFLRSTLRWNDLGWRGFLVAQFVLLLWATPVAESLLSPIGRSLPLISRQWRLALWFCLAIGMAGTVAEMIGMRIHSDGLQGPQAVADRAAYMWVDRHTPKNAVLLFNPDVYIDYFNSLYAYRQTVSAGQAYGAFFSSGQEARQVLDEATDFFQRDLPDRAILSICRRYNIGVIVAVAGDPVWKDPSSWVWRTPPSFANSLARVFTVDDIRNSMRK